MQHPIEEATIITSRSRVATTFRRQKTTNNRPLLILNIAPTHDRPQKAVLNQTSARLGIPFVNTA